MSSIASQIVAARLQSAFSAVQTRLDTISSETGLTFQGFLVKSSLEQSADSSTPSLASALSVGSDNSQVMELLTEMIQNKAEENKTETETTVSTVTSAQSENAAHAADAMALLPACDYDGMILEAAESYGVDAALIKALIYGESGFKADASSAAGAMGLMQLMPHTAEALAISDPYDPAANIDGGVRLLSSLLDRYEGDAAKAVAAYNLGAGGFDAYGLTDLTSAAQYSRLPSETRALLERMDAYLSNAGAQEALGLSR